MNSRDLRRVWRQWYAENRRLARRGGKHVVRYGRVFIMSDLPVDKPLARRMCKAADSQFRTLAEVFDFGSRIAGRRLETLAEVEAIALAVRREWSNAVQGR